MYSNEREMFRLHNIYLSPNVYNYDNVCNEYVINGARFLPFNKKLYTDKYC